MIHQNARICLQLCCMKSNLGKFIKGNTIFVSTKDFPLNYTMKYMTIYAIIYLKNILNKQLSAKQRKVHNYGL